MNIEMFNFDLPDDRIALRPANPRDSAKLLQVKGGSLEDFSVTDLPDLLAPGDVLVLNDTRVLKARLQGIRGARKQGGGGDVNISINLHKKTSTDEWRAFVKPAKRLKKNDKIIISEMLSAVVTDKQDGGDIGLRFNKTGADLDNAIAALGVMPLPPYIAKQRGVDARDSEDYQTVFADPIGSVAAPTAGLHFTPSLLRRLEAKGIKITRLTLHVGAGTFLPVSHADTDDHKMHAEWYSISEAAAALINKTRENGHRVIAVGTTALRALESSVVHNGVLKAESRETDIFITPGYKFAVVDGLMTNFHLPKSTLFMLVSSLCGLGTMQKAYQYAIEQGYRFYSYGDSSLLWKNDG